MRWGGRREAGGGGVRQAATEGCKECKECKGYVRQEGMASSLPAAGDATTGCDTEHTCIGKRKGIKPTSVDHGRDVNCVRAIAY